jgi:RNA polymerase sigma factor (sigma-70 family)
MQPVMVPTEEPESERRARARAGVAGEPEASTGIEPASVRRPRSQRNPRDDAATRFEQCYAAHRDRIYRVGLRYGGNRTAFAEDLTHDVFLKLLKSGPNLDEIENIGAWLHTAAANLAVSRLRAERSLLGRLGRWLTRVAGGVEERSPQVMLELQESAGLATRALASLPPRQRVVVCMKLLDGATQREIAAALAISEASVSRLLARARKRIEAIKAEEGDAHLG